MYKTPLPGLVVDRQASIALKQSCGRCWGYLWQTAHWSGPRIAPSKPIFDSIGMNHCRLPTHVVSNYESSKPKFINEIWN